VLGPWAADLLRGGADVSVDTIGRFYALHVVVLPLVVLLLLGIHLLFVQLQGMSEPDDFAALPREQRKYRKFFWDYIAAEIPVWLFLCGLLLALSAALPRELLSEADPTAPAPDGIKPEWYFLAPYQALKMFPGHLEYLGMALMGLAPLAVVVLPFLDKNAPTDARGRMVTKLGIAALLGLIAMTLWGLVS
jgi:cytochrome b6